MLGIVLGTGPSLALLADQVRELRRRGLAKVYGVNNTFEDFDLDAWIACDPQWHDHYGQVEGNFEKWHWDKGICERFGYRYIEGHWFDGLSTDPGWISYNHSSSAQALNLAVHAGLDPIALVGFDMKYDGHRHYFSNLSDEPGEYPEQLRKFSTFEGLIGCYEHIARQPGLPQIINCTPSSAMTCFPFGQLSEFYG